MQTRFKMGKVEPAAHQAMGALDKYGSETAINKLQREMIKIRASQINGCAYCVNIHTKSARALGETEQRIYLMNVWREAGNIFTEEEQLLLDMTEEVTLIHKAGLSDRLYEKAIGLLGEEKIAQVIMAIITINAWNRIGVSLNMKPDI
jgi:AhpD family alkylhydroperoxidase